LVLYVGRGTGEIARAFAAHGAQFIGVGIGDAMAAIAR
jgi:hypothetical protein